MPNLSFKRGLSTNLPSGAGVVDGAFYLTTDTERLYVGIGSGTGNASLVELNKSIRTVNSLSNLTSLKKANGVAVGDFYYVAAGATSKSGNILAVCTGFQTDGATPVWTQINPDTNNTIKNTTDATSVSLNSKTATITTSISDSPDGGTAIANTASGSFAITASGNLAMTVSGNTITLDVPAGAKYDLGCEKIATNKVGVTLTNQSDASDKDTVSIVGDGTAVTVDKVGNDIKITGVDYDTTLSSDVVAAGGFSITTKQHNVNTGTTTIDPVIKVGKTEEQVHFLSGTADLNVYTIDETDALIDSKIIEAEKSFDSMSYCGTINASGLQSLTTVHAGDTWKVNGEITNVRGVTAKVGDLIIAKGAETNGVISSPSFDVIPSGDEQTITFTADATTGIAKVTDGVNTAGYKVAAGDKLDVSYAENGGVVTATVAHKVITAPEGSSQGSATQQKLGNLAITAVTGLTEDGFGHVTGYTTKTFTAVDTHANIAGVSTAASNVTGGAQLAITVADSDTESQTGNFTMASESLNISGSGSNIQAEIVWGTF